MKKGTIFGILTLLFLPGSFYVGYEEGKHSTPQQIVKTNDSGNYEPTKIYTVDEVIAYKKELDGKNVSVRGSPYCHLNCVLISNSRNTLDIDIDSMSGPSKLKVLETGLDGEVTIVGSVEKDESTNSVVIKGIEASK